MIPARRQFITRSAIALPALVFTTTALKCGGSEQISIYVRTISTFLNQISGLLPQHVATISRITKIAADFDAAYKRGDFTSADTFFNSLEQNLTSLTTSIGINTSNTVKTWLSIIGATVTSIAVLLKDRVSTQPAAMEAARSGAKSAGAVERLASQAAVDKLYQAAKP